MDEWKPKVFTPDFDEFEESAKIFGERITEFMKVSEKDFSDPGDLFFILSDGTHVYIGSFDYDGDICRHYPDAKFYGDLRVDIDGWNKGKNQFGYDRFYFEVTDQGILPSDTEYYFINYPFEGDDAPAAFALDDYYYATAWVVQMGNMDYLKTTDGKTCPNGTVLNWTTNTSCK